LPLIVLVHSGICDARMWDGFVLPGAVRHELRGYGQTPPPPSGTFSHADDLEAALGDGPTALVGASFGGLVCLEVASRRPQLVTDLVLLDAPLPDHDWSAEVEDYWEEDRLLEAGDLDGAAALNADFWAPAVADRVLPMQSRAFELQTSTAAEEDDPGEIDLAAVSARTLVAVGELDRPDIHAIAERLGEEIECAERVVIAGPAHLPALKRPGETAALIRDFLRL
jgi:3-oxoadipate enol-lactonase